jgi:hypothetical protein
MQFIIMVNELKDPGAWSLHPDQADILVIG